MTPQAHPGQMLLDLFGDLHLINLASRTDRKREFGRELRRIGLDYDHPRVHLFLAVSPDEAAGFPSRGTRGCFLSHLALLEQAKASGTPGFLVCEDDLNFARQFAPRLAAAAETIRREPWDIFYLGYDGEAAGTPLASGSEILEISPRTPLRTTHFLAFRQAAIHELVGYLHAILARPPGHPDGGPMHVDGAFSRFRADHPALRTLVLAPPLGYQRASRTDIHALRWFDRHFFTRHGLQILRRIKALSRH